MAAESGEALNPARTQGTTNGKVDIIPHDTWHALCRKEGRTFAGWGCGPNNIAGYKKCGRKAGRKNAKVVR